MESLKRVMRSELCAKRFFSSYFVARAAVEVCRTPGTVYINPGLSYI
jgi:hypothetical protein